MRAAGPATRGRLRGGLLWLTVLVVALPPGIATGAHAVVAAAGSTGTTGAVGAVAAAVDPGVASAASAASAPQSTPWINLTSALTTSPTGREGAAIAYVPQSNGVILFGGLSHNRSLGDTWLFRNGHWSNLTPGLSLSPPARYKASFVEDPLEGGAVLFGGNSGTLYRNDTWLWNGTAWSRTLTSAAPSPREDAQAAYDGADGYLLLFGGEVGNAYLTNDTWTYRFGAWTNLSGTIGPSPPGREAGAAAYDASDGVVLLFGGKHTDVSLTRDTWEYHNGLWSNLTAQLTVLPPARESLNMVYDSVDGYVLMYGGFHFPNSLSDEWSFVGGVWTLLNYSVTPPPREDAAMAFDPGRALPFVVLFGGRTTPLGNGSVLNDTWSYKRPISTTISGTSPIDLSESATLDANARGGYPPLTYSWTGLPPGCPGGNVSTITCTPTASGAYNVSVNVTDVGGYFMESAPSAWAVNADPTASASAAPRTGPAPLNVSFSSSVLGGTAPFAYRWEFGDGGASTIAQPNHIYFPGLFAPNVTVTDARGFSSWAAAGTVNAFAPTTSVSVVAAADVTTGLAPLLVHLSSTASGGAPPYSYSWSFGAAGASAPGQNASFTYTSPGVYVAVVSVQDAIDEVNTSQVTITVNAPPPLVASAAATPASGAAPLLVQFAGSASGGVAPYSFAWQFGPVGAGATAQNPSYTYSSSGSYEATLTVTDADLTVNTTTVPIVVTPPLSADFTLVADNPSCSNGLGYAILTVAALAEGGTGSYGYLWQFPTGVEGPPAGQSSGSATVGAGQNYSIELTVNDSSGATVKTTHSVTAPSINCAGGSGGAGGAFPWLLVALIVVVAGVVAVESFLLVRRRRSP